MRELDLISKMVDETFKESTPLVIAADYDEKRRCLVIHLDELLEIPLGFGPFVDPCHNFYLSSEDTYIYPILKDFLGPSQSSIMLSLEQNSSKLTA